MVRYKHSFTFAFDVKKVVSRPLSIPTIFSFFTMMDPDVIQSGSTILLPFMIKNSSASAIFASWDDGGVFYSTCHDKNKSR